MKSAAEAQIERLARTLDKPASEIRRALANLESRGLVERR
jgi:predicted transcriptional regulator